MKSEKCWVQMWLDSLLFAASNRQGATVFLSSKVFIQNRLYFLKKGQSHYSGADGYQVSADVL